MLSCENLTLFSPESDKILLKNISFCTLSSSLIYIMGTNGIGKTALLKSIAGLYKNYSGSIKIPNNAKINYIGHENAIKPELSAACHLEYWAQTMQGSQALAATIYYLNLAEVLDKKCSHLSEGMRKKLSLSRIMLSSASIWLLDEIDTNLDNANLSLLYNLINTKVSSGGVVLISSHTKPSDPKTPIINLKDFC